MVTTGAATQISHIKLLNIVNSRSDSGIEREQKDYSAPAEK